MPPRASNACARGIADLYLGVSTRSRAVNETPDRRSETSQACNDRFLRALAAVDDTTPLGELTVRLGQPVKRGGRRGRAINPFAPGDELAP